MQNPDLDYKAIRKRVETELKHEKMMVRTVFFFVNLVIYLVFVAMGWGMFLSNQGELTPELIETITGAMIMLTVAGGMGVLFQFIALMLETVSGEAQMRQRTIARVMGEELLRLGEEEDAPETKAKRMMRLSDDGELEEIMEDTEVQELRSRRG